MEKMGKIFNAYKGLVIFYIVVAVLAFLLTKKIEDINSEAKVASEEVTYYA